MIGFFISIYFKFFFLLTPFALLTTFLSLTQDMLQKEKNRIAAKVIFAVIIISILLFFTGNQIFKVFSITLNSFRVGTGILLFLSAKTLASDNYEVKTAEEGQNIAVVPLAMPVAVGPATTGTLLLMGTDPSDATDKIVSLIAILSAILTVGFLLYIGGFIERLIKRSGIVILRKITGLVLAALSAEMVMTGIKGFFM